MAIEREASGFLAWRDHTPNLPGMGVESSRIDECLEHYHAQGFRGLFGSPSFGFHGKDLEFLRRTPDARWLWFWDVALQSIDALYELEELQQFGIHPRRPGIDFSRFPKLESVVNHWIKQDTGLGESTISIYYLWRFNPKSKSFAEADIPRRVKRLDLTFANPAALDGLPVLKHLEELQIHRCRNLEDLSALPRIAPRLRRLLIANSSRVDTSRGVHDHPSLKSAWVAGRELLDDSQ